jgi:hypothetical protein
LVPPKNFLPCTFRKREKKKMANPIRPHRMLPPPGAAIWLGSWIRYSASSPRRSCAPLPTPAAPPRSTPRRPLLRALRHAARSLVHAVAAPPQLLHATPTEGRRPGHGQDVAPPLDTTRLLRSLHRETHFCCPTPRLRAAEVRRRQRHQIWRRPWLRIHAGGEGPVRSFLVPESRLTYVLFLLVMSAYIILWHFAVLQFSENFT